MRYLNPKQSQRGDTLIEVLISMAILGALIALAYTVMSRGFATAQNSLDRTGTQALISGQSALLRAAHGRALNGDTRFWGSIAASTVSSTAVPDELDESKLADGCATSLIGNHKTKTFYLSPSAVYNPASSTATGPLAAKPYFTLPPDDSKLIRQGGSPLLGDGVWIEGYRDADNSYTFYIKSCWQATYGDGSGALRQAKTVVRLYAP